MFRKRNIYIYMQGEISSAKRKPNKPLIVDKQPIKYKFPKNIYQK